MAVNSKHYYDILQDLIDGYHSSYHKSIKMRPLDVHKENEADVFNNPYIRLPKDATVVFDKDHTDTASSINLS